MYSFVTSRFTKTTEDESKRYQARIGKQCLYGSSNLIASSVPEGGLVFVIEMRINETGVKQANWLPDDNQISGIGMIKNEEVQPDIYCDVYANKLFNQFIYMGEDRIDRTELLQTNPLLIELLDTILFKGKTHQKRNAYLSLLNDDFLTDQRNIVPTQIGLAIQRGEIDPNHFKDLLAMNVKQTISDIFKLKRVQFLNKKRKAAPTITAPTTTAPTITAPTTTAPTTDPIAPKYVRVNDDEQVIADFFDGYEAAATHQDQELSEQDDYDFSDFLELWRTADVDLKADANEEALYNSIYHGASILAATV